MQSKEHEATILSLHKYLVRAYYVQALFWV